jgi:hypothetical protein
VTQPRRAGRVIEHRLGASAPLVKQMETIYVVYLPYVPLVQRATVGDWELIPRSHLMDGDCLDARTIELAQGLADLYVLPKNAGTRAGVFARASTGRIGDDPSDPERLRDLQRACVVMVLEVNESPLLPEHERDPNIGHYALTSSTSNYSSTASGCSPARGSRMCVLRSQSGTSITLIMGAGLDLDTRLEIVREIFERSDTTTVHMKGRLPAADGFLPFVSAVLNGLTGSES